MECTTDYSKEGDAHEIKGLFEALKCLVSLQIFAGNFDRKSIVAHEMLPPFYASLVKIHPVSYYGWMSMRVELFWCSVKVRKKSSLNHDFKKLHSRHEACHTHSLMGGPSEWVTPA